MSHIPPAYPRRRCTSETPEQFANRKRILAEYIEMRRVLDAALAEAVTCRRADLGVSASKTRK